MRPVLWFATTAFAVGACSSTPATTPTEPRSELTLAGADGATSLFGVNRSTEGPPCPSRTQGGFAFWTGQWELIDSAGVQATDVITPVLNGCAIVEDFISNNGYRGMSINAFDPADGKWHQHWTDATALLVSIEGTATRTSAVLSGTSTTTDSLTWFRLDRQHFRQIWNQSFDGGATYQTVFDGTYTRRDRLTRAPEVDQGICNSPARPAFQALDFTLGDWQVNVVDGAGSAVQRATSRTVKALSGCLIEERLSAPGNYEALLHSSRIPRRGGPWYRTYVDNRGLRMLLIGLPTATGGLLYEGSSPLVPGGAVTMVRLSLEPQAAGYDMTVTASDDQGLSWRTVVVARYRKGTAG